MVVPAASDLDLPGSTLFAHLLRVDIVIMRCLICFDHPNTHVLWINNYVKYGIY